MQEWLVEQLSTHRNMIRDTIIIFAKKKVTETCGWLVRLQIPKHPRRFTAKRLQTNKRDDDND